MSEIKVTVETPGRSFKWKERPEKLAAGLQHFATQFEMLDYGSVLEIELVRGWWESYRDNETDGPKIRIIGAIRGKKRIWDISTYWHDTAAIRIAYVGLKFEDPHKEEESAGVPDTIINGPSYAESLSTALWEVVFWTLTREIEALKKEIVSTRQTWISAKRVSSAQLELLDYVDSNNLKRRKGMEALFSEPIRI